MRRIVTAITAAALALSLVGTATVDAAVPGYDSAYAGESAFLTLAPGETGMFTVFFANTGTVTWVKGSATQVDLAACLEDKVTCNAQDTTEAPFNSSWLSATRYTTQTQTTIAPGQIGTFTYSVRVPTAAAVGTYRFNGALVLSATGADIHNEGYYQDVRVTPAAAAAVITSIAPTSGGSQGGTTLTITGTGFVCTPAFPTVNVGATAATVTSCGPTSIVATVPAGTVGTANVTVTNAGAPASNAATFTYVDTTRPSFASVTVGGNLATLTFSEPVCRTAAFAATDYSITVNGTSVAAVGDSAPTCNAAASNGVTSFTVTLATPTVTGDTVAVTLTATGAAKLEDSVGNEATAQTRTATATAGETTRPTLAGATGTGGSSVITLTFSEPVYCADALEAGDVTVTAGAVTIASTATNTCPTTPGAAATSFTVTLASPLAAATAYTVTLTAGANETQDIVGNDITSPATITLTTPAPDTTAPLLADTRLIANLVTTNLADPGDQFTVTFNEPLGQSSPLTSSSTITIQDSDGTVAVITCGGAATNSATCTLNAAMTVLTVTLSGAAPTITSPGSAPLIQVTATGPTITGTAGITDVAGNAPNLAGSADVLINTE